VLLNIRVVPRASSNRIKKEDNCFKVYLTKPAQDGLANAQLVEVVARHFGLKKYQVKIIRGHTGRNKVLEVSDV